MGLMRWFPIVVLLSLTACGGSAGTSSAGEGAGDATAGDSAGVTSDASTSDAKSASDGTSDGASDGTTADSGTSDATANDGAVDAPQDGPDGEAAAPACTDGATACVGSTPETCSGGQWVLADAACSGTAAVCLAGGCAACAPGTLGCVGNATATCSSTGTWGGTVDCTSTNQACIAGACTGVCAPNQTQCADADGGAGGAGDAGTGNAVQTCDSTGNWGAPSNCVNETCVSGACTGTCAPGQTQCSGNGVQTCSGGTFGTPADCGSQTCFDGQCGVLVIAPTAQSINVTYGQQTPTVQYTATINGSPVPASFSTDSGQIGGVAASTGLMTPTGTVGGTAHISATYMNQTASTPLTVTIQLTQNGGSTGGGGAGGNGGVGGAGPGGPVGGTTVATLNGTPIPDVGLAWLYPYNNTLWPQGLLPPLLQWQPGAIGSAAPYYAAVQVSITEPGFAYTGYFAANATNFINIPVEQIPWNVMAYSNSGGAPITVSLVFATASGVAYGPLTETWYVSPGTLQGTVYYNSYGTNLATNYCCTLGGAAFGGATLAIKNGALSPTLVAGTSTYPSSIAGCRVCHSVSADGSTLVTQHGDNYDTSSWYALATYAESQIAPTGTGQFAWPALFPDGSILLADGAPLAGSGSYTAQLFNTQTGATVASTGIPAGLHAGSPVFSPDGTHVAFTFTGGTGADGISLAAMDFNKATSTFSNFRVLYKPSNSAFTALWPSFMPTNNAVIFELQVQYNGRDWGGTRSPCDSTACANESTSGAQGETWWVDLGTKTAARLATLDGLSGATLYVPKSSSHVNDSVLDFEPTVNPVVSGGEAWVVFTTRRLYGNVATLPPYYSDPRYVDLTTSPTPKKLWVAAVDLNATPGTDPSHPAFYLPAQEILAGNSRGYWVVNPCQANGTSCQSGDECCGGYCEATDGGLQCSAQPPACSQLLDKCTSNSDCCGANLGVLCINGFCSEPSFTQ
ncbi:MAG TPA: hypothetical protein VGL81_06780 [Polyangiaceae bacterium]|jgi:hypothetical protein